eukprot:XP_024455689.1 DDT domain-containing protein DDB_G0282237 isoform X3 [Populus trichocarpa]
MPLLKKKPFTLLEPPKDLEPNELVYQVRFTKEIFRDYEVYLNRINLYRQRFWTCKVSGKGNLTYEEALVSEKHAAEKVPEIPKELMTPALRTIHFSMLSLKDLADTIAAKLQEHLFVGAELHGKRKKGDLCPCKILKVLEDSTVKTKYEVAWLDRNKKVTETAVVNRDDLIWKKSPFSRNSLKPFIRKSTRQSFPWVLHDKLAEKYRISMDPPQDLKGIVFIQDGAVYNKRKKDAMEVKDSGKLKKKKVEAEEAEATKKDNHQKEEPIKYPIDDLLVQPETDDPVFTVRPLPSRDFNVPMDGVGDLLMVWDFLSSFSKLLHLWPFSLEDFENAICRKGSNVNLIVETHSSLIRLLKSEKDECFSAVQKRTRALKITLTNWTDYLCDFLEIINIGDLSTHITTIKRGHYGLLDAQVKLGILRELVNQVLETDIAREKLAGYVEERQVLLSMKRGEALEEGRKKREEKEWLKAKSVDNGATNGHGVDSTGNNQPVLSNGNHIGQNGQIAKNKGEAFSTRPNHASNNSRHLEIESKKTGKKKNMGVESQAEKGIDLTKKEASLLLRDEKIAASTWSIKERRRAYFERELEKRILHTNPLGKDRDYNRYWWFKRDGRVFVESSDSKLWGCYCCKEEIDALMGSLNPKGERERALQKQVEKFYSRICLELQKRSKDLATKIALEEAVHRRSTRVRALPRENPANAFLNYVNRWKED